MYEGTRYAATLHSSGSVQRPDANAPTMDGKIKAPPPALRMWLVVLQIFRIQPTRAAGASPRNANGFNASTAIPGIGELAFSHNRARDDFNPR